MESLYLEPVDGARPICHEGCNLRDWLVVTGSEAGHVWHDATADCEGWKPLAQPGGVQMSFADFYLAWLDDALATIGFA